MPPKRSVISATAPVRVCDIGGWTDTWFAEHGRVLNIAVLPFIEVQLLVGPRADDGPQIVVHAENYGDTFSFDREQLAVEGQHSLLKAAFSWMEIPDDVAVEASLYSAMPPGASTGTSAAISIALVGALDMLTPGRMSVYETARAAQRLETEVLGLQCGIQDQLCAAFGGINYIEMFAYPEAAVSPLLLPQAAAWELERRMAIVYLGDAHVSSAVHAQVIGNLEESGADDPRLQGLRECAPAAKDALYRCDFQAFAEVMNRNTEIQSQLHSSILSPRAKRIIELARQHGAIGAKLNGAGGDGGSLTLLFGERTADRREFGRVLAQEIPEANILPIALSAHGLRIWQAQDVLPIHPSLAEP